MVNFLKTTIIIIVILTSCSSEKNTKPETVTPMAIKQFKDSLNTAVFATKFIVVDKKDITIVRHESEDGAWTFFSDDKYENYETVAKIVGLGEIIKIDSTVLEIAEMPIGYYASRKSKKDKWKVEKLKEK